MGTGAYEISIFHALARREKNSHRISNFKLIVNQYCEVHYLLINLYRLLNDRKVIKERWSYLHINFLVEFLEWLPEKL
ncbi:unnamed protein product [Rhizophagus irregularis]|nr:unnamed protein product [Rhizophagus irregularis]